MGSGLRRAEAFGRFARRAKADRRLARAIRVPLHARAGNKAPDRLTVANRLALLYASLRSRIAARTSVAARTSIAARAQVAARTKVAGRTQSGVQPEVAAQARATYRTTDRLQRLLEGRSDPMVGRGPTLASMEPTGASPVEDRSGATRARGRRASRDPSISLPIGGDYHVSPREKSGAGRIRLALSTAGSPYIPTGYLDAPRVRSDRLPVRRWHHSHHNIAGWRGMLGLTGPAPRTEPSLGSLNSARSVGGNGLTAREPSDDAAPAPRGLMGGPAVRQNVREVPAALHHPSLNRGARQGVSDGHPAMRPKGGSTARKSSAGGVPASQQPGEGQLLPQLTARQPRRHVASRRSSSARGAARRADRFVEELGAGGSEQINPLPSWAAPLARSIHGAQPARIVTGTATRRALRSVGAVAATTGTTVHLAVPPRLAPESIGVLAHELSHVADHVVAPRFFGGDLADHGEGRARALGTLAASAAGRARALGANPVAAATGVLSSRSIDRAGARGSVSSLPVGGVGGLIAAGTETARNLVMRSATPEAAELGEEPGAIDIPPTGAGPAELDPQTSFNKAQSSGGSDGDAPAPREAASKTAGGLVPGAVSAATDSHSRMGELLEALEERVLAELERRGGRWAGVF